MSRVGLEPTREVIPGDFKSPAYTNFATATFFYIFYFTKKFFKEKAWVGIAPTYNAFAERRLTPWLPGRLIF